MMQYLVSASFCFTKDNNLRILQCTFIARLSHYVLIIFNSILKRNFADKGHIHGTM